MLKPINIIIIFFKACKFAIMPAKEKNSDEPPQIKKIIEMNNNLV